MAFEKSYFIKPDVVFDRTREDYAPMFRKKINLEEEIQSAVLTVCGLGYGYYYINGEAVSEDLFTAPVSDYRKTLWYNRYDVTDKLYRGENVFAVICGNGWYNENLETAWDHNMAEWRDIPKFILSLEVNGEVVLVSDDSWKYTLDTPYLFNQLRQGEHFDSRRYQKDWTEAEFDDSAWAPAKKDDAAPKGVFRECLCEPIRECEEFVPVSITKVGEDSYLYDFGENISGYARLRVNQPAGDRLVLNYAEQINEDNTLNYNGMDDAHFYKRGLFQTDEFICCGEEFEWTPKFTYHGFRYVRVDGLKEATKETLTAVFVHQTVELRSEFKCSNELFNTLFALGRRSTLSNMCYGPTDCPTREKLGWMNDAQASIEQFLTNFELERVLSKWWIDICDSMHDNGEIPGIVPTPEWGYEWGNGPVSEGTLFEIPYRMYLHTGDDTLLKQGFPYFKRSIAFWNSKKDENGDIAYGLEDWASPDESEGFVDNKFVNGPILVKCLRVMRLAAVRLGEPTEEIDAQIEAEIARIKKRYIREDGTCTWNKQTAVAMLIYNGIYDELEPLKQQLIRLIEERDFHHNCGMVGLRYLYIALNICGLQEYAYRIVNAKGFPSYSYWVEDGATALYERWNKTESKNHHMYSDFMSWMMKTIVGIKADIEHPAFERVEINPYFFEDLTFAEGACETVRGRIGVRWEKKDDFIQLEIEVPFAVEAYYQGKKLKSGINKMKVNNE